MKVAAIAAHPDDIEIACAGTLLKCRERGDEIYMVAVCNGNMGHKVIMPDELARIREEEFRRSAKMAGATPVMLGYGDANAFDNKECRDKLTGVLKEIRPDLIITHSPNDYMPDHVAVSNLVFSASFASSLTHYPPAEYDGTDVVPIAFMDNLAGNGFVPNEYVDISSVIETKIRMLESHESQLKWMREHDRIDFAEFVRSCSHVRGLQCGVDYAEGFCMSGAWGRVRPYRMLP